ncbi:MAG: NAD(P)-dependent oxidoreductase [Bryobacteraceae bacterium]
METIGLVGCGLLGSALAARFIEAGYGVLGYDVEPARLRELEAAGGRAAGSVEEVARACGRVMLVLPNSDVTAGLLECFPPGGTLIDATTGDPEQIAGFGRELAARGVRYLDATVGGSSKQTRAGDVTVMCGGEREVFDASAALLGTFARQAFYMGPWGSGARMKLVNNLVLGLNRAVLAEGLRFARACGIDPAMALPVLQAGPAWSRAMDVKGEKMLREDFTPEARLSQHLKDVRLILAEGARRGAKLPLSELHRTLLERAEAAGYGAADNSAVIKAFD